jgi:Tol biopolymer transport system component
MRYQSLDHPPRGPSFGKGSPLRRALLAAAGLLLALIAGCSGSGGSAGRAEGNGSTSTGQTLAIVRDQRLLVRAPNGEEKALLRTPANTFPSFPVWSPDGTHIAYVQTGLFTGQAGSDWGGDIFIVEAGGGTPRLVWKHDQAGAQVQGLAWLPDGRSLLMGYQLTLVQDGKFQGQVLRVERLEIDTGARTPIVQGAVYPSVSRDGTRIAYLTQDDTGAGGLWVAAPDGSDARRLVEVGAGRFLGVLGPQIAPDGSAIAFAAVSSSSAAPRPERGGVLGRLRRLLAPPAEAHGFPMDVWKVGVTDGALTRLTDFGEDEPYPAWTPDGRMLYVIATGGLYTLRSDGADLTRIGAGAFGGQLAVR